MLEISATGSLRRGLALGLATGLLCVVAMNVHAAPQTAPPAPKSAVTEASVQGRLANVKRLIEVSSGAQRVQASQNAAAHQHRARAKQLAEQANAAFERGKLEQANQLLEEATREMFAAVRELGHPQETTDKQRVDFEKRIASAEVLLSALERISVEKSRSKEAAETARRAKGELARARQLFDAGSVEEGRAVADAAYEVAKLAVEDLREGDTVVRSLEFETKEEEYLYEVDRNDTHRMLIDVLLEEKRKSQGVDQMVKAFVEKSNVLRKQAEQEAARGDFEEAIRTLEESTKELVRAIRGAGVFIPG